MPNGSLHDRRKGDDEEGRGRHGTPRFSAQICASIFQLPRPFCLLLLFLDFHLLADLFDTTLLHLF